MRKSQCKEKNPCLVLMQLLVEKRKQRGLKRVMRLRRVVFFVCFFLLYLDSERKERASESMGMEGREAGLVPYLTATDPHHLPVNVQRNLRFYQAYSPPYFSLTSPLFFDPIFPISQHSNFIFLKTLFFTHTKNSRTIPYVQIQNSFLFYFVESILKKGI